MPFKKGHKINNGKIRSPKYKEKMSLACKGLQNFLNKTHSSKTLKKLSFCKMGSKNPNWQGGRRKDSRGYILILQSDHPLCDKHGYVMEHRLVMEKKLGRYLTSVEVVHHINGILDDNKFENLRLFANQREHVKFHHYVSSPLKSLRVSTSL